MKTAAELVRDFTAAREWAGYREQAVSADASPLQVEETQMAFYAGVVSVVKLTELLGEPDVTEEVGMAALERVREECTAFLVAYKLAHGIPS